VLADSEPEPDVALVRLINGSPVNKKPLASDVLLVIEVSTARSTTIAKTKIPLYAENGIPEAWLVDVPDNVECIASRRVRLPGFHTRTARNIDHAA